MMFTHSLTHSHTFLRESTTPSVLQKSGRGIPWRSSGEDSTLSRIPYIHTFTGSLERWYWWPYVQGSKGNAGGFPGVSNSKESPCNVGDLGSIPGLGRSPGEGNGSPHQYSGLENPMDRGAWLQSMGLQSWTRLSNWLRHKGQTFGHNGGRSG